MVLSRRLPSPPQMSGFMKFAGKQLMAQETRPFTYGILLCFALLAPLGRFTKETRLTSTYHTPPKHH